MLKELLLAGIGAVSLTREKIDEVAHELIRRGELTAEEKHNIISNAVYSFQKQKDFLKEKAYKNLSMLAKEANIVTKDEYNALLQRVTELESKLNKNNNIVQ